jgi:NDP-mannose synthase
MKAVIMAGGRGTRLAPFTKVLPKPLIPLGDHPILEIIICQLRQAGIIDVVLAVNYMADLFRAYFQNGERLRVNITYSLEEEPLGTAGALTLIEGLDQPFIVMNADLATDLDFADLYDFHVRNDAAITMALYPREVKIDFGVIELDEQAHVLGIREKPSYDFLINMGIYVVNPEMLKYLPYGRPADFPTLVDWARADGQTVLGYVFRGTWMDLGRVEDFDKASETYAHLAQCVSVEPSPLEEIFSARVTALES